MRTLSKQSFANDCFYALKKFCFKDIPNGTQDIFGVRKANFSLSVMILLTATQGLETGVLLKHLK